MRNQFCIGFAVGIAALCAGAESIRAQQAANPAAFAVEVRGKGPAVVLIPGLASSGNVWRDTVAALGDRFEFHVLTSEDNQRRVLDWAIASDPATVGHAMYEMNTLDLRQDLARITVPTLTLGTWLAYRDFQSKAQTEQVFRRQYAALPDWQLVMSDTARHFVMLDDPAWFHAQLERFLSRVTH